jgi:hypothetical protein
MALSLRRLATPVLPFALALAIPLLGAGLPGAARAQSAPSYPLIDTGIDPAATGLVTVLDESDEVVATIVLSSALPNTSYTVTTVDAAQTDCPAALVQMPDGTYALLGFSICAPSGDASAGAGAPVTVMTDAQGDADVTVALPASAQGALELTSSTGDTLMEVLPNSVPAATPTS